MKWQDTQNNHERRRKVKNDLNRRDLLKMLGGALLLPIGMSIAGCGNESTERTGSSQKNDNSGACCAKDEHLIESPETSPKNIPRLEPIVTEQDAIAIAKSKFPEPEWIVTEVLDDIYHQTKNGVEIFRQCWMVTLKKENATVFTYIDAMTGEIISVEPFERPRQLLRAAYADVPFYSQVDSQWRNNALGYNKCGDSTIGRYGCYLSCMCMLYGKWGYSWVNPPFLNDWYNHHAFTSSGCGDLINRAHALQYAGQSYPSITRPYRDLGGINDVLPQLQAGRPVIARIHLNANCTSTHFMVIYDHDGTNFLCKDPLKDWNWQNQVLYGYCRSYRLDGYQ